MKYQKQLIKIRAGEYKRSDLVRLRENAVTKFRDGDLDAKVIVDEIDRTTPKDKFIVFMGFCPGADIANRLDGVWKGNGTCTFDFPESPQQTEKFNNIWPGDLIVLKKRQRIGETMRLYGHGRVKAIKYDASGDRYLEMDWSTQEQIIEMPLMGCNSTVDVKDMQQVEDAMPESFFEWLKARG